MYLGRSCWTDANTNLISSFARIITVNPSVSVMKSTGSEMNKEGLHIYNISTMIWGVIFKGVSTAKKRVWGVFDYVFWFGPWSCRGTETETHTNNPLSIPRFSLQTRLVCHVADGVPCWDVGHQHSHHRLCRMLWL